MNFTSKWLVVVALLSLTGSAISAGQSSQSGILLESAKQKETLEGDLRGAIRIYQDIVNRFGRSDRAAAATAMLRMAECYERLGDPQGSQIYQRLMTEYPEQTAAVAAARTRLASGMPTLHCEECGDELGMISPDGRLMATVQPYMVGGERAGDIGLFDLASKRLTPLQIEGSGKGAQSLPLMPVFSPDGRQLAYAWLGQTFGGIRVVSRDAPGKTRLLPDPGAHQIMLPLGWTSAGIVAIGQMADQTLELLTIAMPDGAQRVIKPLKFNISPGPGVARPSFDGRYVAYEQFTTELTAFASNNAQAARLDRQIHVVALDGSSDVPVTSGAGVKRYPIWTPTGSHVLYISNVAGAWDLWATPMQAGKPSGAPLLVKKSIGNGVMSMGMSASGHYFFYEGRAGVFRTMVAPVATASGKSQPPLQPIIGSRPAWSPDGLRLAVSRPQPERASGVDIVVHVLATGDERVYRREGIMTFPFIWFPDGSGLLVQVQEAPGRQFWYRVDLATGEFRRLVQQRGNTAFWTHQNVRTLSADGRTLYFGTYASQSASELDRITALDLESGAYRDVVRLPLPQDALPTGAQDLVLAASADGRSLAIMYRDRKLDAARLAVVGVDGSGFREILSPIQAVNMRNKLAWSRDGQWIYFSTKPGGPDEDVYRVMRVRAAGGAPEAIGADADGLDAFDLSPDGARIAFSTLRPEGWGQLLWSLDVSWLMKTTR